MRRLLLLPTLAALALAPPARGAEPTKAGTTVQMTVTEDGYVPAKIVAKKGEPLTLVITRKTDRTCATELVVKEYGINAPLPLGKAVTVTFTPTKAGQVRYACGMDMISGTLVVQ
jgi:plastocyanin domain-containing protein